MWILCTLLGMCQNCICHGFRDKSTKINILRPMPFSFVQKSKIFLTQIVVLANIAIFSNLLYDYYQYRINGKLPKVIKWIPYM